MSRSLCADIGGGGKRGEKEEEEKKEKKGKEKKRMPRPARHLTNDRRLASDRWKRKREKKRGEGKRLRPDSFTFMNFSTGRACRDWKGGGKAREGGKREGERINRNHPPHSQFCLGKRKNGKREEKEGEKDKATGGFFHKSRPQAQRTEKKKERRKIEEP